MAVFPVTPISEDAVRAEMKEAGGKQELMQKISERMRQIEEGLGGSRSDIQIEPNHEYRLLEAKLRVLNRVEP